MPDYEGRLRLWRQEMKLAVVPQAAPHITTARVSGGWTNKMDRSRQCV